MTAVAAAAATRVTRRRLASVISKAAIATTTSTTASSPSAGSRARKSAAVPTGYSRATAKPGSGTKRKTVNNKDIQEETTIKKPKAAPSLPQPTAAPYVKATPWVLMTIPRSELDLSTTLKCGQSFRWHREHLELPSGEISLPIYSCVIGRRLWCLQETEDGFKFRTFRPSNDAPPYQQWSHPPVRTSPYFSDPKDQGASESESGSGSGSVSGSSTSSKDLDAALDEDQAFLQDYLQLGVPLTDLYAEWSETDANFKAKAPLFPGVRILRQDPVENLVCFICSSNNNIARISQMATKLCQEYGTPISIPSSAFANLSNDHSELSLSSSGTDDHHGIRTFYGFPTIEALAQDGVEEKLRELGFGYRAKYIARTAKMIHEMEDGRAWLMGLRNVPYQEAHEALLTLQGVGPKVADCVCLMSLDKQDVIPVDTHVWQIAVRDYKFRFEGKVPKTISPAVYKAVGKHFLDLFGQYSGWAHTVLFAADLRVIEGRVIPTGGMTEADIKIKLEDNEEQELVNGKIIKTEHVKVEGLELDQDSMVGLKNAEEKRKPDSVIESPAATSSSSRRQPKRIKG